MNGPFGGKNSVIDVGSSPCHYGRPETWDRVGGEIEVALIGQCGGSRAKSLNI